MKIYHCYQKKIYIDIHTVIVKKPELTDELELLDSCPHSAMHAHNTVPACLLMTLELSRYEEMHLTEFMF